MTDPKLFYLSNTTDATSGTGNTYLSEAPVFTLSCYGVRVFLFSSIYVLWLPLWRIQAFLNQGNKFSGINTSAWWLLTYICIHYSMLALNISKKRGGRRLTKLYLYEHFTLQFALVLSQIKLRLYLIWTLSTSDISNQFNRFNTILKPIGLVNRWSF